MRADRDKGRGKKRRLTVRRDGRAHMFQAEKQQAESSQDAADPGPALFFPAQQQGHADPQQQRREKLRAQRASPLIHRDEPGGQGRSDVRAHDDTDCLCQRHQPGIHESHCHDRGQ